MLSIAGCSLNDLHIKALLDVLAESALCQLCELNMSNNPEFSIAAVDCFLHLAAPKKSGKLHIDIDFLL